MGVCLIQVPYMAGDDRHESSRGPKRLLEAGASRVLAARGIRVTLKTIDRGEPFRDTAASAARVNKQLASVVRKAVDAGQLPIVLAGSCNSSLGVVAGFDHAAFGVVWLDGHADFNTPESTLSGFFPGMSVAVITGHCYCQYWPEIGDSHRLRRLRARGRARDVDEPVPGGLSFEDAEGIMRAAAERFRIRAATLATYTPELDKEERTLRVGLRIIELLGGLTQQSR
jgi:arginase family enzyme